MHRFRLSVRVYQYEEDTIPWNASAVLLYRLLLYYVVSLLFYVQFLLSYVFTLLSYVLFFQSVLFCRRSTCLVVAVK